MNNDYFGNIISTSELEEGKWYLLNERKKAKFMKKTSTDLTSPTIDIIKVNLVFIILTDYSKEPEIEIYSNRNITDGERISDFSIKSCKLIENQGYLCFSSIEPYETNCAVSLY